MATRPVASKLLAVGGSDTGAAELIYTVPVGMTTIIKQVTMTSHASADITLYLSSPVAPGVDWFWIKETVAPEAQVRVSTWFVLPQNWTLVVQGVPPGVFFYWVSGSELEGVNLHPTVPTLRVAPPFAPRPDGSG